MNTYGHCSGATVCQVARRLSPAKGPGSGSRDGQCEVRPELECAWQLIYDRAKALGMLNKLEQIAPPQDWSEGLDGGPRKVVREDQCIAGLGPKA